MPENYDPPYDVNAENQLSNDFDNAVFRVLRPSASHNGAPATAVITALLRDRSISFECLGALIVMLSRADSSRRVDASISSVAQRGAIGRHRAVGIVNALLRSGYLIRGPRDQNKQFQYFFRADLLVGKDSEQ